MINKTNYIFCFFLLLVGSDLVAQYKEIEMRVSKTNISLDEEFTLEIIWTKNGNLKLPSLTDFVVLNGPMMSSYTQQSNINGKVNSITYKSYSYLLRPIKKGKFTIKESKLVSDGTTYKSNPITISVGEATNPNYHRSIEPKLLILTSKNEIYQGEAVILSYTIHHNFVRAQITGDQFPEQIKCWKYFLDPGINSWKEYLTTYKGNSYTVVPFKKEIVVPNQTGTYKILPFTMTLRGSDQFSTNFYNLKSDEPIIQVKPLPNEPDNFCGGIGNFKIKLKSTKYFLNTGEGFDLVYTLSGKGNLNSIQLKKPVLPKGFEIFDAEITDKIKYTENGIEGSITFSFPIIAKKPGKFEITPEAISYFDPEKKSYQTIQAEKLTLEITGNELLSSNGKTINEQDTLIKDIKDIITKKDIPERYSNTIYGTKLFFISIFTLPFLYLILLFKPKEKILNQAEIEQNLAKKASQFATEKLSLAQQAINQNNYSDFYLETHKSILNYLNHKFQIKSVEVSKDNLQRLLEQRHISKSVIVDLIDIIEKCEFARYGSQSSLGSEQTILNRCVEIIDILEKS